MSVAEWIQKGYLIMTHDIDEWNGVIEWNSLRDMIV
jgi:hypothetical protein